MTLPTIEDHLQPYTARTIRGILSSHAGCYVGTRSVIFRVDAIALMQKLPPASVDLLFADPPYDLSHGGTTVQSGKRVMVDKGDWDHWVDKPSYHAFNQRWLSEARRVLRPQGTIWVSGTHHAIFSLGYAMQQLGFRLLNKVTWFKSSASPNLSCRMFTHSTEDVIWAAPRAIDPMPHVFNYALLKRENGGKQMRDMWPIGRPAAAEKRYGSHPTQKPVALLDRIICASSLPGQVVLDPFCGSGTTGVAAVRNGRLFIGADIDPVYLNLTQKRLQGEEKWLPSTNTSKRSSIKSKRSTSERKKSSASRKRSRTSASGSAALSPPSTSSRSRR